MSLNWPWIVAVAIGWLAIELVAWALVGEERPEFVGFFRARLAKHWPLAAFFALPGLIGWLQGQPLMWGTGFVILWWVIEAIAPGEIPMTRSPLRCLGPALRGLGRSPLLVLLLIIGIVGGQIHMQWASARYRAESPESREMRSEGFMPVLAPGSLEGAHRIEPGEGPERPELYFRTVFSFAPQEHVPQMQPVWVGWYTEMFAAVALLAGIIWVRRRRPDWLNREHLNETAWPIALLALYVAGGVLVRVLIGEGSHIDPISLRSQILIAVQALGWTIVFATAAAPLVAAELRVFLQVAAGRRWDLRSALISALESWLPVAVLSVITGGIVSALLPVFPHLWTLLFGGWNGPWWVSGLEVPLSMAVVLAGWIIVDQRVGIVEALRASLRIAIGAGPDLIVFALRYTALSLLVFGGLNVLSYWAPDEGWSALRLLRDALGIAVTGLMVLSISVLYLRLREEMGSPVAKEPSEAPDTGGSEDG